MILMIDNYDSFTYNLVQYLGELGEELVVRRNDAVTLAQIERMKPNRIVISPGPGTPKDSGISRAVIRRFGKTIPLLGVCLGHQCIGDVFGATIESAERLMHGKTSQIYHADHPLFAEIENPFTATRYHSLIVRKASLPPDLEIIAWTGEDEVMGIAHTQNPIWGVQFHPESILTERGKQLLKNFLDLTP